MNEPTQYDVHIIINGNEAKIQFPDSFWRDYFAATIPLTQLDIDLLLTDPLNAFIAEAQLRYIKADAMLAMKARAAK